ncbi:DinB family protein [Paucisalibacillus globulus]|uniref:DinB family protein n=1 Tax=Paucisalibacillus globulus TaxID=351095 RepID=UPI0003FB935A|nr:DinB family protein [Paucisalibacillus globulus]
MLDMFLYNWQVREDWFKWCESLSVEELRVERIGGMGSILKNLVHIIDCELVWVNYMLKEPLVYAEKDSISCLEDVIKFSNFTKTITQYFLWKMSDDFEKRKVEINSRNGTTYLFTNGKIIRHMISHEIHHIGQLSIWAREMGLKPISSDLIIRVYS